MISGMAQSATSQTEAECSVEHDVDYWEGDIVIDSEHSPACWRRRCLNKHPCHCLLPLLECLAKVMLREACTVPQFCRQVRGHRGCCCHRAGVLQCLCVI